MVPYWLMRENRYNGLQQCMYSTLRHSITVQSTSTALNVNTVQVTNEFWNVGTSFQSNIVAFALNSFLILKEII